VNLAHTGFIFTPDKRSMERMARVVADRDARTRLGIFFCGAVLGMTLPALLYVTFLPGGTEFTGTGHRCSFRLTAFGQRIGPVNGGGSSHSSERGILFKTQLDNLEADDAIHHGHPLDSEAIAFAPGARWRREGRVLWCARRNRSMGNPCAPAGSAFFSPANRANVAGFIFIVASIHLLYVNTRLLPQELRPPLWRRAALVLMSLFYATFWCSRFRASERMRKNSRSGTSEPQTSKIQEFFWRTFEVPRPRIQIVYGGSPETKTSSISPQRTARSSQCTRATPRGPRYPQRLR
jgi:hypothetical protein